MAGQDIETPMSSGATDHPEVPQESEEQINESTATAAGYPIQHDFSNLKPVGAVTPLPNLANLKPVGGVTPLSASLSNLKPVAPVKPLPQATTGEIRQAPPQSLWERAKSVVEDSAIGHALEQGLPKLGVHPKETIYSPEYEAHKEQLLSPEQLISPTSQDISERAARGVLKTAGGLTTPLNLMIMAATEGLGVVADVPSVAVVQRLISAGFSYQMLKSAVERYPQIKQAIKDNDYASAAELISQSVTEAGVAAQGVTHAAGDVTGEHAGKIEVDEATKKILQDRMDVRKAGLVDDIAKQGKRTYFRPAQKPVAGVNIPITAAQQEGAPTTAKVVARLASPGGASEFMQQETRPAAAKAAVSTLGQMAADKAEAHAALREGRAGAAPISGTSTPSPYATVDEAAAGLENAAKPTYQAADAIDQQERQVWEEQSKAAVDAHKAAIDEHNKQVAAAQAEGEKIDAVPFDAAQANLPERPKFLSELRAAEEAAWTKAKTGNAEERAEAYDKDIPKAEKDTDNWFKQHEAQIPANEYESAKDLTYRSKRLQDIAATLRAPMLNKAVTSRTLNGIEANVDNKAIRRGQQPGAFRRLLGDDGYQNWKSVVKTLEPTEPTGPNAPKIGLGDYSIGAVAFGVGLLSHIWGGALGIIIPLEFAKKFVLDRALFDPEFGSWWKENFNRFKRSGGQITPDMIDSLHGLIEKKPLSPQELKDAGFTDKEVASGAHTPIVGPKLSQGPAPAGPGFRVEESGGKTWLHHPNSDASRIAYEDVGNGVAKVRGIYGEQPGHGQELYDAAIEHARNKGFKRFEADDLMSEDAKNAWRRMSTRRPVRLRTDTDEWTPFVDLTSEAESAPATKLSQAAARRAPNHGTTAPAGASANEPVTLGEWDDYVNSGVIDKHPVDQAAIEKQFPGQKVTEIDPPKGFASAYEVELSSGKKAQINIQSPAGKQGQPQPAPAAESNMVTVYRGSKEGSKSASGVEYFTPNKDYAAKYGAVKATQLDTSNFFDPRKPEHKAILDQLNSKQDYHILTDPINGLPLYSDATRLSEALKGSGHNFDGMALSENAGILGHGGISYAKFPKAVRPLVQIAPAPKVTHSFDPKAGLKKVGEVPPTGNTTPKIISGDEVVKHVMKTAQTTKEYAHELVGLDAGGDYVLQNVPLSSLTRTDNTVPKFVKQYANMPTEFPAIVLDMDGKIRDGNHRVDAAAMRGDKTIKAYVPIDSTTGIPATPAPKMKVQ